MRKQLLSLVLIVAGSFTLNAQMSKGHFKYSVEMSSNEPEAAMWIGMMAGSTMDIYFDKRFTRAEMDMGTMMKTITISDNQTKEVLTLTGGMMGNTATRSKIEEDNSEVKESGETIVITDESKEILGFTCKKATVEDAEGNESVVWFTEDISIKKSGQSLMSDQIPGFPMQMEVKNPQFNMVMTATEFSKKVKGAKTLFDMSIPEGYEEKSMDEMMNEYQQEGQE